MKKTSEGERFRFLGSTPDIRDQNGSETRIFQSVDTGVRLPIGSRIEPDIVYKIAYKDESLGLDPVFGELWEVKQLLPHRFEYVMIRYHERGGVAGFFPLETDNGGQEFFRSQTYPCLVEHATKEETSSLVRSYD